MDASSFRSLGAGAHARLVRARQAHVEADRILDALLDRCECRAACRCHLRDALRAAKTAEALTGSDLLLREVSWREFCSLPDADVREGR
jgi:hypothetical protein